MTATLATMGTDLVQALPRGVVLLATGCFLAHLLRRRTGWQHAMLFTVLSAQLILVLHAVFTPSFTWRILPALATPVTSPLPLKNDLMMRPRAALLAVEPGTTALYT